MWKNIFDASNCNPVVIPLSLTKERRLAHSLSLRIGTAGRAFVCPRGGRHARNQMRMIRAQLA